MEKEKLNLKLPWNCPFIQRALGCLGAFWVEMKRLLKYGNSRGWLEWKPGAVCIAQRSRWLFHSLITVWSGEMNGSYLRWNNNPLWNPSWIGTTQDDTRKPPIRAGHLAQSGFIWWGLLQHAKKFKITLAFLFIDYKIQRTLSVRTAVVWQPTTWVTLTF